MAISPKRLGDTAVQVVPSNLGSIPQGVIDSSGSPLDYLGQGFSKFVPTSVSFPRVQGSRVPQSAVDPAAVRDSVIQGERGDPAFSAPAVDLMAKIDASGKDPAEALHQYVVDQGKPKDVNLPDQTNSTGDLDAQNRVPGDTSQTPNGSESGKVAAEVALPANIPAPDISGTGYDAAGLEKKRAQLVAEESTHIAQAAQEHTKAVQMQIDANAQSQRELDMQRQKEIEAQAAQEKTISSIMDKHQSLMADVSKLAASGIDPNHYWADKNAGQRAAGGIAAFLFGIAGKGIDYINQINEEVNRDIKVQQMNYENRRASLNQQIEGNQTMYAMARQKGLDAASAAAAARAGLMQSYAMHLENAKLSGENAEAASRTALAIDALKQKALAASEEVAKTAAGLGMQNKALVEKQWEAKTENERERYKIQMAAAAKAGTEKEPPAALKKSVDESLRTIQAIKNAESAIPDSNVDWAMEKAAKEIPGTDSAAKRQNFIKLRDNAMFEVNHGVLHPDDVTRLSPAFPDIYDVGAKKTWGVHRDQALLDFYNKVQAFDEGLPEKKQFKALPEYKEAEALARKINGVKGEKAH